MEQKIKALIGEDVDSLIIGIYIDRAIISIKNYLNNKRFDNDYIIENFEDAIVAIVENSYKSKDNKKIKSFTEGKQSITYSDSIETTMTEEIIRMLPSPYVRMM